MYQLKPNTFLYLLLLLSVTSCIEEKFEDYHTEALLNEEEAQLAMITDLEIPSGFDFSTEKVIALSIHDKEDYVKYDVLNEGNQVFTGIVITNKLEGNFALPTQATQVSLIRRSPTTVETIMVQLSDENLNFVYN